MAGLGYNFDKSTGRWREWDDKLRKFGKDADPTLAKALSAISPPDEGNVVDLGGNAPKFSKGMGGKNRPPAKTQSKPIAFRPGSGKAVEPQPVIVKFQGKTYGFDDLYAGGGRWREVGSNGKFGKVVRADLAFKISQMYFPQYFPQSSKTSKTSGKHFKVTQSHNKHNQTLQEITEDSHLGGPPKFQKGSRKNIPPSKKKGAPKFQKIVRVNVPPPGNGPLGLGVPAFPKIPRQNVPPGQGTKGKLNLGIPQAPPPPPKNPPKTPKNKMGDDCCQRVLKELGFVRAMVGYIFSSFQKANSKTKTNQDQGAQGQSMGGGAGKTKHSGTVSRITSGHLHGDILSQIATNTYESSIVLKAILRHYKGKDTEAALDNEFKKARALEGRGKSSVSRIGSSKSKSLLPSGSSSFIGDIIGGVLGLAALDLATHGKIHEAIEKIFKSPQFQGFVTDIKDEFVGVLKEAYTSILGTTENIVNSFWEKSVKPTLDDVFTGKGSLAEYEHVGEGVAGTIGGAIGAWFAGPLGAAVGAGIGAALGKGAIDEVNSIIQKLKQLPGSGPSGPGVTIGRGPHGGIDKRPGGGTPGATSVIGGAISGALTKLETATGGTSDKDTYTYTHGGKTVTLHKPEPPKSTVSPEVRMTKEKNIDPQSLVNFFKTQGGLTDQQAKGIVGSFQSENGNLDPTLTNPGIGIGQWRGSRADDLKKFAKAHGNADIYDPNIQAQFALDEIKGKEAGSFKLATSGKNSSADMAEGFVVNYERSSKNEQITGIPNARRYASKLDAVPSNLGDTVEQAASQTTQAASGPPTVVSAPTTTVINNNVSGGSRGGSIADTRPDGATSWENAQGMAMRPIS